MEKLILKVNVKSHASRGSVIFSSGTNGNFLAAIFEDANNNGKYEVVFMDYTEIKVLTYDEAFEVAKHGVELALGRFGIDVEFINVDGE